MRPSLHCLGDQLIKAPARDNPKLWQVMLGTAWGSQASNECFALGPGVLAVTCMQTLVHKKIRFIIPKLPRPKDHSIIQTNMKFASQRLYCTAVLGADFPFRFVPLSTWPLNSTQALFPTSLLFPNIPMSWWQSAHVNTTGSLFVKLVLMPVPFWPPQCAVAMHFSFLNSPLYECPSTQDTTYVDWALGGEIVLSSCHQAELLGKSSGSSGPGHELLATIQIHESGHFINVILVGQTWTLSCTSRLWNHWLMALLIWQVCIDLIGSATGTLTQDLALLSISLHYWD